MSRDFLVGAAVGSAVAAMADLIGWALGLHSTVAGHVVAAAWFAWLYTRPAAGEKGRGE